MKITKRELKQMINEAVVSAIRHNGKQKLNESRTSSLSSELLSTERFDENLIKSAIQIAIDQYDEERRSTSGNITSGEITNRLIINGLTLAEAEEVYNYFYNGGYSDYEGKDYGLW